MNKHMKQNNTPPIKEGEEYEGRIVSVGEKGDGIMRVKGFVVFVPEVKKGDYIKVKITKVLAKVSFGKLIGKAKPPKEPALPKIKKWGEDEKEDVSHLLHADDDSEDFGEEIEEDEDKE